MRKNKMIMGAVGMAMLACPATYVHASETDVGNVSNVPILTQTQSKNVDSTDKGSITIQLEKSETATDLASVKFGVIKVADLVNGEYILTDSFKSSDADLNNIANAEELQKVATKLFKDVTTFEYEEVTSKEGTIVLSNLNTGVYLLAVTDNANYDVVLPTLVSIPTYQDIVGYNYNITVEPKHSPTPEKPKEDEKKDEEKKEQPDTGVNSHFNEYLAGAGVSMACIAAVITLKKRSSKDDGESNA